MSTMQIRLLGSLRLVCDGAVLPPLPTERARALFGFLALHPGRMFPRDALIGLLWPDHPRVAARRHLQLDLRRVRRLLGGAGAPDRAALRVSAGAVGFHPATHHRVDVTEFERCARVLDTRAAALPSPEGARQLRRAVELYRGDLLEGIEDDWCVGERKRLRLRYVAAVEALARFHRQRGELDLALSLERRTGGRPGAEVGERTRRPPVAAPGSLRAISGPVPPLLDQVEAILAGLPPAPRPPGER